MTESTLNTHIIRAGAQVGALGDTDFAFFE
jgi:hypothetical protein